MRYIVFIVLLITTACQPDKVINRFEILSPSQTGIDFRNDLVDTPEFNILEYLYYYNGGGVAIGDLNNDGLPDIYFTSNQGNDHLYYNQGEFKFRNANSLIDSSDLAGWSTGVTMVDINCDGWLDIYVCKLGNYKAYKDNNKLFINLAGSGFVESASEYGLDFSGFGTHAAFFDYDNDGDVDCYLLNHSVKDPDQFKSSDIRNTKDVLAGDLLLENQDLKFVDITESAGIFSSNIGFGLSVNVADVNDDSWLDILVTNDFHEQDYLYINNRDKTFSEVIQQATGHTSNFSMGSAIADINNDLHLDLFTLDMKPFDESVYKKSGGWESFQIYDFKRSYGYHHQSPKNALQLFTGIRNGIPIYSEQAALYDIEATDWSWSPLVADFDNDGDKDIFITNGIVRRPNDLDFIKFDFDQSEKNKLAQIKSIPEGLISNQYLENDIAYGTFNKRPFGKPSASTGASFADLDNDGNLDIVINNINESAQILRNNGSNDNHYLNIKLSGTCHSHAGTTIKIFCGGKSQMRLVGQNGFQSQSQNMIHFGLGAETVVDSIHILWPGGSIQKEMVSKIDTTLQLKKGESRKSSLENNTNNNLFTIHNYKHLAEPYTDHTTNSWSLYNMYTPTPQIETHDDIITLVDSKGRNLGVINYLTNLFTTSTLSNKQEVNNPKYLKRVYSSDSIRYVDLHKTEYIIHNVNESEMYIADGFIQDAIWVDLNNDQKEELVVIGNWMPIQVIEIGEEGNSISSISNSNGLWFTIETVDVNNDGNMDLLLGNFGLNHSLQASTNYPMQSYTNDFDKNGTVETLVSYYKDGNEIPYPNQEMFVKQLPHKKKKFLRNQDYVNATLNDLIVKNEMQNSKIRKVNELQSCLFLNTNGGEWNKVPLPHSVQVSPIYAIEVLNDNTICFGGNLYDVDPNLGRQDGSTVSCLSYNEHLEFWTNSDLHLDPVVGEIRDLHFYENKLYMVMHNDSIQVATISE